MVTKNFLKNIISSTLIIIHRVFLKFRISGNKFRFGKRFIPINSKIIIKGKRNNLVLGNDVKFQNTKVDINGYNNTIIIEDGVRIYDSCSFLIEGNNCVIGIGTKTTIGSASIFCGESNTKISIGENCLLSRLINIDTSDFHSIIDLNTSKRINASKDVKIGNRVWIGYGVSINKGCIINDDSMVGIKSVVTGKEFPKNTIIAGFPAKVIRENIIWSREKLEN